MRRQVRFKRLGMFALGAAVLAGAVHLIHERNVRRSADLLLRRAGEVAAEGKPADRLDLLKRYLAHRPDDLDALEQFAGILAGSPGAADRARALEAYEKLLSRDPGRAAARRRAAGLAAGLDQADAARAHYEALASNPEGDAPAEMALGRSEADLKRFAEAAGWYEKAIAHDPHLVAAYAPLARLLREQLKDPAHADRIMDARAEEGGVVARNPGSARARLDRAAYRREFGLPGAADDVKRALELAPDDADALLAAAAEAEPAEAARLIGRGIAAHPDDARFYSRAAVLEAAAGRRGAAIDRLAAGVARIPEDRDLRWLLAEIAIDDHRKDRAEAEIARLRELGLPAAPLDFLAARLLADAGQWGRVARELERVAPTLEATLGAPGLAKRAFLLLAQAQAELDDSARRQVAARRAVAIVVADPALALGAQAELGAALLAVGRPVDAANAYREALGLPGAGAEARRGLCRALITANLALPAAERDWAEVDRLLGELEAAEPLAADLALLRAEVLVARGDLAGATARLDRAAKALPDAADIEVARATLAGRREGPPAARVALDSARARLGDRPELIAALAQAWAATPGPPAAEALAALVGAAGRLPAGRGRDGTLAAVADGLDRTGQAARARAIRDGLIAERPDHLGLRVAAFEAALRAGDRAEARRALDEVRRVEGAEGAAWRFGEAVLLVDEVREQPDRRKLAAASGLLVEAQARRPGWARATRAAAEVDDLRGDLGSAAKGYMAALAAGDRDPAIVRRAAQVLARLGRSAEVDALLARVEARGGLTPELTRMAAEQALRSNDPRRAVDLARKAAAAEADSPAAQMALGRALAIAARTADASKGKPGAADAARAKGLRDEAERAFRRSIALAPRDADARLGLLQVLVLAGDVERAGAEFAAAAPAFAGPAGDLAEARALEVLGRSDRARAKYQAILRSRPDDVEALRAAALAAARVGRRDETEPPLRRLIALAGPHPAEAAWARRSLALLLAGGGQAGAIEAGDLLGLGSADSPDAAPDDDLRAQSRVLARQIGRAARRRAIGLIETLITRDAARPDDRFLRAQLLAATADWPRARSATLPLLAEDPSNPVLLLFLARGDLDRGDVDAADEWTRRLDQRAPGSFEVVELKARASFARRRPDEAVALLRKAATEPKRVADAARVLEAAGQVDAARDLLGQAAAAATPADLATWVDRTLTLASFLGRRGLHSEAIAQCEKLWADRRVPPGRVSAVALTILYTGRPDPAALERVGKALDAALDRDRVDVSLRFDQANYLILRGDYKKAEDLLGSLHESHPRLSAPLNNLAWLLALRREGGPRPLELINQAIARDGPLPDLLDTRGLIETLAGRPERAIPDLEESIAAAPNPTAYFHLALALRKAGRDDEAAAAMIKARDGGLRSDEVHPLERPAYLELATAFPPH